MKVRVTYKPEGAQPRQWDVDLERDVTMKELGALKKASGIPGLSPLVEGLQAVDGDAVRGLLWLMLKRDLSTLAYDDLDLTLNEIDIDPVEDEPDAEGDEAGPKATSSGD